MTTARLVATDPGQWQETATAWRAWAAAAGRWVAELKAHAVRLRAIWRGAAADAAAARLSALIGRLVLFRIDCWVADQALSEFATALARARSMVAGAAPDGRGVPTAERDAGPVGRDAEAVAIAAQADSTAADRLDELRTGGDRATPPALPPLPCTATPTEVRRWWEELDPAHRRWLLATRPGRLGPLDGIPAAVRDVANRLLLDDVPAELPGLDALRDRLADGDRARAYLLKFDPAGEGQAVVAVGDPDRAANVLTQVPGMTADLASYGGELARAERIAGRATELAPTAATSTVMWLGYDAPDFVHEAAGRSRATAGAIGLRHFQEGLRATHLGPPAHRPTRPCSGTATAHSW